MYKELEEYYFSNYAPEEYPTLRAQREEWIKSTPFKGLSVLDATPLCRNSIYKYMNLVYGGAKLHIGISLGDDDPKLISLLQGAGITLVRPEDNDYEFDIILDCSAEFITHTPRIGCVELTRARSELYKSKGYPVFMADGGTIKRIETCLGTGESYYRTMNHFGYNLKGKNLIIFGSGKVGQGLIRNGLIEGAQLTVVTDPTTLPSKLQNQVCKVIDYRDRAAIEEAVSAAYAVVTATGLEGAVSSVISPEKLISSSAILANMGATDEFGTAIPTERVLNNKETVNFALNEPTQLKYIDATLALHNYGAQYILDNRAHSGVILPPTEIEDKLLEITIKEGLIAEELAEINQ